VRPMPAIAATASAQGFHNVESRDLSALITTEHMQRAMVETKFGFPLVTPFGRRHAGQFTCASLLFGELRARKPR
jgi:hypothetical protein